jgi:ABC-type uncharacterized transport system permease subunit
MHEMSVFWLRCATALYAVGLLDAIVTVLRRDSPLFRMALVAFGVGTVFHFVSIVELSVSLRSVAANNFFETASLCALLIAIVFLFVQWKYQFAGLSLFLFPLVFLLALIGAMGSPVATWTNPSLRDAWLITHIVLVLAGYAALLLAASAAVFYLIQERRLKSKKPGGMLTLPPLDTLDTLVTRSMSIGFVAITLAVIAGTTWAFIESGTKWISEAKVAVSLITWGFYLLVVCLRFSAGWRGRKAALATLMVLCFGVLTWAAHVGLRPRLLK